MCAASKKKDRNVTVILIAILLVGVLTHSAVLWTLNRLFPPATLAYTTTDSLEYFKTRMSVRNIAEIVVGVCSTVFFAGNIVMIYSFIKNSPAVSFYKLFFIFFATIAAMFLCAAPFAISDNTFWGDYLFPLWNILAGIIVFFLIVFIANLMKHFTNKRSAG